jgi:hypothetical protein
VPRRSCRALAYDGLVRLWAILVLACGCDRVFLTGDPGANVRRRITVTPTSTVPIPNFVVSVTTDRDAGLAMYARADGGDIGFIDAGGAPLPFERVHYAAGSLEAWVRIPLAGQTTLEMVYGGGPIAQNPSAVWSDDVLAAYHLDEADRSASDSTQYANDLVSSMRPPASRAGTVGAGAGFSEDAAGFTSLCATETQSFMLGDESISYSMWLDTQRATALGVYDTPFYAGGTNQFTSGFDLEIDNTTGAWTANFSDGSTLSQTVLSLQPFGRPTHLGVVLDRSSQQVTLYLDGKHDVTRPSTVVKPIDSQRLCLGNSDGADAYTGMLDEVRVYRGVKPAAWFDAEADNVLRRAQFVVIGDE